MEKQCHGAGLALDNWTQITQRYPAWVGPALARANLLLRMARPTEARDQCQAVLKIEPDNESAKRLLVSILLSSQGEKKAVK